jgi:thiamine biosynthesis lipoprotein
MAFRRALLAPLGVLAGCVSGRTLERFEFREAAMGTEFRVVLYARDAGRAQEAGRAALERVRELEAIFSDYDPTSENERLARMSDAGAPTAPLPASRELVEVAAFGQELARESGGAFDLTVGPLTRLWRQSARRGELAESERIARARAAVGYLGLEVDRERGTLCFLRTGMRLDFGALAKGLAVDEALGVLRTFGIERALVVGGGELRAGRAPPGRAGWTIELASLAADATREVLCAAELAVATSGDLERFVEVDGKRHSHVLDPRSGESLSERRLATVLAADALSADALATAIEVLGAEEGLRLARARGVEARVATLVAGEVEVRATPGFARALSSPGSGRREASSRSTADVESRSSVSP